VKRAKGVKIFQFLKISQGVFFLRCGVLVCRGVLLTGIVRGDFFFERIISWVGWSD
jgi:hypothetical protein